MEKEPQRGIQILEQDEEGNLRPSKGIAVVQRIMIDWGKNQLQKAYQKDKGANVLRKQKWKDDNIQEREGILYWKGRIYLPVVLREEWMRKIHEHPSTGHPGIGQTAE